jgi:hypothetical protein
MKLDFFSPEIFSKKAQVLNFMKSRQVGSLFYRADRHDEADICFSKFWEHISKVSVAT